MAGLQPANQGQGRVPWHDFEAVLAHELNLYIKGAELPPGIAANLALMENFFCIVVCLQTKTPLIIVGTPGHPPLHLEPIHMLDQQQDCACVTTGFAAQFFTS